MALLDEVAVRDAIDQVRDPELPAVTLAMLGVIHDVRIRDGHVEVDLLPTFAGCPAIEVISDDVRTAAAAIAGVLDVTVHVRFSPPWTSDRISPEGHEALRDFGIAPPGTRTLPVLPAPGSRTSAAETGRAANAGVACPYCGATDTTQDSPFGPTPCRALHHCAACRQPFERFKDLG